MLIEALKEWRSWGLESKPQLVKEFTGGQNHHTGLITIGRRHYVLKVFNHSFERAIAAERLASDLKISPKLLYAANNIALFDYIKVQARPEITLTELAQTLARVHACDASSLGTLNILSVYDDYLFTAYKTTRSWHQAMLPALEHFIDDSTPWCFCHNDLVQENCLVADKLVLIDWEFAQQHNPWFDLAAVVLYFRLDHQDASDFLRFYKRGWQNKTQDTIFYTSQVALLWGDLLWNMHKFGKKYRINNPHRFEQLGQLAAKLNIDLAP